MNDDQRAKFEKWAADADRRDRRRAVGRVDAWEGWCACLAANAIDQPLHAIVKCLDCAGSGRIGINMEVCPTCLGAGWIYQEGTDQPQPPADDEPCKCGFRKRAADKMAAVLDDWVYRDIIDPRSAAADARLGYGEPFSDQEVNRILGRPLDAPFERSVMPADDERERLRDLLRRCLAHVEQYDNLRTEIEAALAKREERA